MLYIVWILLFARKRDCLETFHRKICYALHDGHLTARMSGHS